jgi:hypothetical protein
MSAAVSLSLGMVRRVSTRPVAARCQRRNRRASCIRRARSSDPRDNCSGGENTKPLPVCKNRHSLTCHQVRMACKLPPAVNAASSAMIAMLSRSSAPHRARSRVNAAAKDSARSREARTVVASRAVLRRLYYVEREIPSASQGRCAGCRGPMPCAPHQRSERKWARRAWP